jgi:NADH:ubiquinone oxidoreductase subunit B-like Fe-S oxidoreductase
VLHLLRHAVLKTVKLHVQSRCCAIEIQKVNSDRMLAAKFEAREAMTPQRAPKFFSLVGLVATKLAGGLD